MDEEPIGYRVVTEVATAADVDPADLPPLHDVVDPDALESLFDGTNGATLEEGYVSFTYEGFLVRIEDDGTVSVSPVEYANGD